MGTDEELTSQQRESLETWFDDERVSGSTCWECGGLVTNNRRARVVHVKWHERIDELQRVADDRS